MIAFGGDGSPRIHNTHEHAI